MPSLVPLDNLTGAAFLGFVVSVAIYGITCLQAYLYYTEYSDGDRKFLKAFVGFLMVMDTLHVALVTHTLYWYTITNFGDYAVLAQIVWSLEVQVGVAYLLALAVQGFFAWRVYMLSGRKNWWIPLLIILTALGMFACSIGFMIFGFRGKFFANTSENIPWTTAGLGCELAADFLIMGSMTFYLLRGRTGFEKTHTLVNTLILYTLNTGFLTTVLTILNLAMFVAYETTLLYTPFFFVLVRIYSCSFLSTLNSRKSLRSQMSKMGSSMTQDSIVLSNFQQSRSTGRPNEGGISFTTSTHVADDSYMYDHKRVQAV